MRRSALSRRNYFVLGLLLGLALSFYLPQDIWELVQQEECPQQENSLLSKFGQDFEPHLNLINKPLTAKKPIRNVFRPRYYSSELGIREKLFIGVLTSQENINTQATAINRTTAHLVNKIKYFINADSVKTSYKLKNIVGFTDTRESLRPFHVIKYIADNYLDDYDYFLIIPDTVYVDARKLKTMLYHMSITFDIYMGTSIVTNGNGAPVDGGVGGFVGAEGENSQMDDFRMLSDRNYCDLDAGILLSSSVIRKMRNNLDWCVRNGITNVHSVNIGRCVKYSSKLAGCQESFQAIRHQTFRLGPYIKLFKDLNMLSQDTTFRNATTVYPITNPDDFYRIHSYFARHHLDQVQEMGYQLEHKSYRIANASISNNILEIRWPLGVPASSAPETRHDILIWHLINRTHIFLPNADNVVEPLRRIDSMDFEKVLEITLKYAAHKYSTLEFVGIHTAYRRFDSTRGMDYHLHLNFRDSSERLSTKSFEVVKPLGHVEVVPSPYVTESTRVALLVPTFEHQAKDAIEFITQYERICMQNQDNTFLLMIFLYRYESSSRGESDSFRNIKSLSLELSSKYKNDGSRIAWVSIRLPSILSDPVQPEQIMLTSLYGHNEILSIAVADLALPKIGLDSLVLMGSPSMTFKQDFINRVRMNTIQAFQVFSAIGFTTYPCRLTLFCEECEACDVSQKTGYYDKGNYDVMSFYSRDYVQARKKLESSLPITRSDNDIEQLLTRTDKSINTILDMFVHSKLPVHILRGVEPNLRFGTIQKTFFTSNSNIPKCPAFQQSTTNSNSNEIPLPYENLQSSSSKSSNSNSHKCVHLASRKQIGDAIIRYEDRSILHK